MKRTITFIVEIQDGDYFANDGAAREWAARLHDCIYALKMSNQIVSLDYIIDPKEA